MPGSPPSRFTTFAVALSQMMRMMFGRGTRRRCRVVPSVVCKQAVDEPPRLRLRNRRRVRIAGAIVPDRERVEKIPRDVEPRLIREITVREVRAARIERRPLQSAANGHEQEQPREQQRERRAKQSAARRLGHVSLDEVVGTPTRRRR